MSFLDNLESTLKALEAREEKDANKLREQAEQREAERQAALARAPHAEALKTSEFTNTFLAECRAQSRPLRVMVRFTWIGDVLRLDANEKRLELTPTPTGIEAIASLNGEETSRTPINLTKTDPAKLATKWLTS